MAALKKTMAVFPASAGVILIITGMEDFQSGRSRVSGGDPKGVDKAATPTSSFPRKRG